MAREKANYRDTLGYLTNELGLPLLLNKGQASKVLKVSRAKLAQLIAGGELTLSGGMITIGSVANLISR